MGVIGPTTTQPKPSDKGSWLTTTERPNGLLVVQNAGGVECWWFRMVAVLNARGKFVE